MPTEDRIRAALDNAMPAADAGTEDGRSQILDALIPAVQHLIDRSHNDPRGEDFR
jgi:hypothetical protein